jgi:hypothetical protein
LFVIGASNRPFDPAHPDSYQRFVAGQHRTDREGAPA